MNDLILALSAFLTSTFAAIVGLGGGMLLISIVPFFLPVHAIIPVHGVSQFASNLSRSVFSFRAVAWPFLPAFLIGSFVGILCASFLLLHISTEWLPLFIGFYILCHLWWPRFKSCVAKIENFYFIGAIQTGLGPLVGATGPLTTTLLMTHLKDKDAIVSTNALFMAFTHMAKLALFAGIGFQYLDFWREIIAMTLGAILGSYVGTLLRKNLDGEKYTQLLRWVLTLLALKMMSLSLLNV